MDVKKKLTKIYVENLTERDHLGDKTVERMEMLKYNSKTEHKA
jgi:hypothetical protein